MDPTLRPVAARARALMFSLKAGADPFFMCPGRLDGRLEVRGLGRA
jgi:hypothetical protein